MAVSPNARLLVAWLTLVVVTLLAWWLGAQRGEGPIEPDLAVGLGAFAITAVKVHLIVREFMDVRRAGPRLRKWSTGILGVFVGALVIAYLW